jgi:signal transduction histidine kinase/CheY-like chemotaxis protein
MTNLKSRKKRLSRIFWRWSFFITATAYLLTAWGIYWYTTQTTQKMVLSTTQEAIANEASIIAKFRNFYSAEIVSRAQTHGMIISHDYKTTPHTLPLPATLMIDFGQYLGKYETNTTLSLYSDRPFPWRVEERKLDNFQKEAIAHLSKDPTTPYVRQDIRNGQLILRYAQSDVMQASCVNCHNNHPSSSKTDWKVGDVRGVLELSAPLNNLNATASQLVNNLFYSFIASSLIGLSLVWFAFTRLRKLAARDRSQARRLQITNNELAAEMQKRAQSEQALRVSQAELIQSRDKAESANRLKDQFLANMSHEIRTPTNGIMGMITLVLQTKLTPTQQEYLELAHSAAEHLVSMVADVLDFSKIDAGHLTLRSERMSPMHIIKSTTSGLSARAEAYNLPIYITSSDDFPNFVLADPIRFRQIITNLVGNAIKFTRSGHIQVYCDVPHPQTIQIAVSDTGIGFDPHQAESLFAPFVQADSSLTRSYGGTGLGLAITRSLIDLMGGHIHASSVPGQGSVFTFTIHAPEAPLEPLIDAQNQAQNSDDSIAAAQKTAASKSLHILIAEDHPINQKLLTVLLEKMGHTFVLAEDGAQALAALNRESFDLVLMDVMMPGVDGITALTQWREIEKSLGTHTPIIMVTAHVMKGDEDRFLAAGADGYVSKPISVPTLMKEMTRVL